MRGITRQAIKTRSGVRDMRVERRAIPKEEAEPVIEPEIVADTWRPLGSIAEDVARQLRGRIAFPLEFYKGASE